MSDVSGGTFSVGGLMSGIDTDSMFAQLETVMRKPIELAEERKKDFELKLSVYSTLQSKLETLRTAAKDMDNENEFFSYSASSEDTDILTGTATSNAIAGSYDIKVDQLARAHTIRLAGTYSSTDTLGTGTLTIKVGDNDSVDVDVTSSNNTISGLANEINSMDDLDVRANVIYDGDEYILTLTSKNTGEDNIITVTVDDSDDADYDASGLSKFSYEAFKSKSFSGTKTDALGINDGTRIEINDAYDIIVNSTDSLQDIADRINDTSNFYTKGDTSAYAGNATVAKAVVIEDDDGKYYLRVDGVENWRIRDSVNTNPENYMTGSYLDFNTIYRENNTYFYTDSSIASTQQMVGLREVVVNGSTISVTDGYIGDIASEINSANCGATASLIADPDDSDKVYLKVTGVTSWSTSEAELAGKQIVNTQMTRTQIAQDAKITLNDGTSSGLTIKRSTNSVANVIGGVTINLKQSIEEDDDNDKYITITVDKSSSGISEKITTFVDAYNEIINYIAEQQAKKNPETEETKTLEESLQDLLKVLAGEELEEDEDNEYGPLLGDSTTNLIKNSIMRVMYNDISGVNDSYNNLSDIGITMRYGRLEVDSTVLENAISADAESVMQFFTNDDDDSEGLAVQMIDIIDNIVEKYKGEHEGVLAVAKTALETNIITQNDRITDIEDHIESELELLRSQFNTLEVLMGDYQTTSSYLANQISSLS